MSDFDDDMMYDYDEDEYGGAGEDDFEFYDEDEQDDGDSDDPVVMVENKYFEAKDIAEEEPEDGLAMFEEVLEIEKQVPEEDRQNWGFKALKRIIKLNFQLKKHDEVKKRYEQLVTERADFLVENEKALNSLLDYIADAPDIKHLFDLTLQQLKKKGNKKACLRLELRLAKVLLQKKDYRSLEVSLDKLHEDCQLPDGSDDQSKGNQLMEIYALKIAMFTAKDDLRRLKVLYEKALNIKGLCNPRISGIIHECGGKMHMREKSWEKANTDFFEAFKNYDDAGTRNLSCKCLKYLVLANMLSGSKINPFHEQRAKSYQSNAEIKAMIDLIRFYQENDIRNFEKVLAKNKDAIMGDDFMKDYIEDLMKKLRSQVLLQLIRPYTNISIRFISGELNIKPEEVESLLVELILDKKVRGKVDQIEQLLLLTESLSPNYNKYVAIQKWTKNLSSLEKSVFGRVN